MSNKIPQQLRNPIFAYMRRSTTKEEQGNSLIQQEEMIDRITKELWINIADVSTYIESRSGFENKTRKEFERMIADIDKSNGWCIVLCRDSARLSRNENDSLRITNRIFWDYKTPKKIKSIFFFRDYEIEEWNDKGDKEKMKTELFNNYLFSVRNGKICFQGTLRKLDKGEFPRKPPHGLSKVGLNWEWWVKRNDPTLLRQNEKMPFIKQAFEMKAKWRTAKEICDYLKKYGNIDISTKNIAETVIENTVYMGEYTEKKTGIIFNKINFWERKPPIDRDLWERANAKIGKRGYGYGEWQSEHIAPWLLKFENGKDLYIYKSKKKYNAYQTEIPWENGKRKSIGLMESRLVREFLDQAIPKVLDICYNLYWWVDLREHEQYVHSLKKKEVSEFLNETNEWYRDMYATTGKSIYDFQAKSVDEYLEKIKQEQTYSKEVFFSDSIEKQNKAVDYLEQNLMKDSWIDPEGQDFYEAMMAWVRESLAKKKSAYLTLRKAVTKEEMVQEKKKQEAEIEKLTEQKKLLEKEKSEIDLKAFRLWYDASVANAMKESTQEQIKALEIQIQDLSESSDFEQYLDRLPEILKDLHELASKVLSEADYQDSRDEIRQLIQLVSHELTLTTKKELKVKLFEGLENLEIVKMWNGRTNRKGYIRLSIYHKMRKRQYGNRWMTQFVPLCREEVRRLENRQNMTENDGYGNSVQSYISDIENDTHYTNSMHGVTL